VKTAILIPAYNEETTIGDTIDGFRNNLPNAEIWVCDNNSSDATAEIAANHGAIVVSQMFRGKGNAIRRLLATVEADVYVMVDGDGTYDSSSVPMMIEKLVNNRLDVVIGLREGSDRGQYRKGHVFGNKIYSHIFSTLFGLKVKDLLSGYRVMSRKFVKTFPCVSRGFEIETEINAHLISFRLPFTEVPTKYSPRPPGSESKLHKVHDGMRILFFFILFLRDYSPFKIFFPLSVVLLIASIGLFVPVFSEFLETGEVARFPTLFVSVGLSLGSMLSFFSALVLDAMKVNRQSNFFYQYNNTKSIDDL
jgi:glycosyltransferase involved in cell wall biosynthesis